MSGVTPTLGNIARRVLLVAVAVTPALVQALTTPRFRIVYEGGPRIIALTPPTGELISCGFGDGTVRVSRDAVLTAIRLRIADRRSASQATTFWERRLAEAETTVRADVGCSVPAPILAALLSRGAAQITATDGEKIERIAEWGLAWVHDGRPGFYGFGDGRAFMLVGCRYRPDPEGSDCGAGCIVYSGDHQSHSNFVI